MFNFYDDSAKFQGTVFSFFLSSTLALLTNIPKAMAEWREGRPVTCKTIYGHVSYIDITFQ